MGTETTWKSLLLQNRLRYIDEFIELLKIPSISTDSTSVHHVQAAAKWVASRMKAAGIENVEVSPTGEHACVYGDWLHAEGKPTVLIYGHFDVQPPDPLELWTSPPFEPVIEDGKVFARGASDMKGNLLLTLIAAEALLQATGSLPVNVKFLFEGQEEIGSRDLAPFVSSNREKLACDLVLTPDGMQWTEEQPALFMGTKGLCALQIDIETAGMDLHSGLFGGAVPNANHALVELLGTVRDPDGNILIEGFYDQVAPLSDEERAAIAAVPFDAATYETAIGVDALVGEPGYSTYERAWARPTLEINGIWGGYQGDGVKTVIPAKAHAKITCRLVANQEPEDVLDHLESHLLAHKPAGARLTVSRIGGRARPYLMPRENVGVQAVADALADFYNRPPYYVRVGGTLPIMDMFLQELNAYTVVVGFGLDDERIHSPNEFMRLANFEKGQSVYALLFEKLGDLKPHSMSARP
jgi:acetylornithine deacetylase/succinyl-diaminopimelate desuccinylase-like protein